MASLGELVAAARLNQEMPSVQDHWQNGWNNLWHGIGQIYGSKLGGKISGGVGGQGGASGGNMAQGIQGIISQFKGGAGK